MKVNVSLTVRCRFSDGDFEDINTFSSPTAPDGLKGDNCMLLEYLASAIPSYEEKKLETYKASSRPRASDIVSCSVLRYSLLDIPSEF